MGVANQDLSPGQQKRLSLHLGSKSNFSLQPPFVQFLSLSLSLSLSLFCFSIAHFSSFTAIKMDDDDNDVVEEKKRE